MDKKFDNQITMQATSKSVQSGAPEIQVKVEVKPGRTLDPNVVDRPGFDLGGSTGETTAGAGLGLGGDAGETRPDRSLPGRHAGATLSIPRWSGSAPKEPAPLGKEKVSSLKRR